MLQDPLQDISAFQNIHDKIYAYLLHNLTMQFSHVSIGSTFKTDFKFDCEYYGEHILWT